MMKLCTRHQHDLMTAIRRRGLARFISPSDAELIRRSQLWLAGRCERRDLDPLAIATFEIYAKAIQICGDYVQSLTHQYCPLCEVHHFIKRRDIGALLISGCTDTVLSLFVENELVAA